MSESLPDAPPFITRYLWRLRVGTVLAIAVLVLAIGSGWFYFLRAPSPDTLCDHVAQLRRAHPDDARMLTEAMNPMANDDPGRPMQPSSHQQCMWYFTTEQKQRGYLGYGRLSRCVSKAPSPTALFACL